MDWSIRFIITSIMLGVGLAMDAFSVSLANGLHEPCMRKRKMCAVAGIFAIFQGMMPMFGWLCVHTIVNLFQEFAKFIPWIALGLLCFIGGHMLIEGLKGEEEEEALSVGIWGLIIQGIATSIDALSVGFTISEYGFFMALACVAIIAIVTFIICMMGIRIGKCCGTRLAGKATIFGGIILILIGIEIWITGVFF